MIFRICALVIYRKTDHGSGGGKMVPVGIHAVGNFRNWKLMVQMDNDRIHYKKKPGDNDLMDVAVDPDDKLTIDAGGE